jgi:predicted O-methyltransferase YrrM
MGPVDEGNVLVSRLTRRVAASPLATPVGAAHRVGTAARVSSRHLGQVARWLKDSREHTNFTFALTPLNRDHLAWWVADVTGCDLPQIRAYIDELEADEELRDHIVTETAHSPRKRLADSTVRYHKRLGWYALIRASQPLQVVETGTDKGLGAVVMAAALLRNGKGHLVTMDVNPDSGYLVSGKYADVVSRVIGDSVSSIERLTDAVDMFVHDSLHTEEHEAKELDAIAPKLSDSPLVLSDFAHASQALPRWAEAHDMSFSFWAEQPENHWFAGEGIGLAFRRAVAHPGERRT